MSIYFNAKADCSICKAVKEELHIRSTSEPGKYLGIPAVWGRSKKEALNYLKTRIQDKLEV